MVVKVSKPEINVREKISELDKPSSVAGEAMLRAETPQEQFNLIGAGRRNLIINGAMQVSQRGTSFTGLQNNPAYTVDRFEFRRIGAWSTAQFAVTQESDGPPGFPRSVKLATTTAQTDTSSIAGISTMLEGQDLQSLKFGTTSAESMTLSFWVKSYQTGTYSFVLQVVDLNTAIYGSLYTINQSNTWEYKTITIPAPVIASTTAIDNDHAAGFEMVWHFAYRDSAGTLTNNSWDETSNQHALRWYSVNGQTINGSTSTSNYLQITGVQLEVGKIATPFEHRSYGEELALCQRYFQKSADGTPAQNSFGGHQIHVASGQDPQAVIPLSPNMRTTPGVTLYSAYGSGTTGQWYGAAFNSFSGNARAFGGNSRSFIIDNTDVGAPNSGWCEIGWTASAEL